VGKFKNLTGQRFGRLIARQPIREGRNKAIYWLCECDCGNTAKVVPSNLRNGHIRSCGCFRRQVAISFNTTHGLSKTRFNQTWRDMIDRTHRKKNFAYNDYGNRGITVCDEWMVFENFMSDMHETYLLHCESHGEKDTTIDRIDNNKGYRKENCQWATYAEQSLNRRNCKTYFINGEYLKAKEIADKYGLTYPTVMHRIHRGWPLEQIAASSFSRGCRRNETNCQ